MKPKSEQELFLYAKPIDLKPFYKRGKKPIAKLQIEAKGMKTPFQLRIKTWYQDPLDVVSNPIELILTYKKPDIIRVPLHLDPDMSEGKYTLYFNAEHKGVKADTVVSFELQEHLKNKKKQKKSLSKKSLLKPELSEIQFPRRSLKTSSRIAQKKQIEFSFSDPGTTNLEQQVVKKMISKNPLGSQDFATIPKIIGKRAPLRGQLKKMTFARLKIQVQSFPRYQIMTFTDEEGKWEISLPSELPQGFHTVHITAEDLRDPDVLFSSEQQVIAYAHDEENIKSVFTSEKMKALEEKLNAVPVPVEKPIISLLAYRLHEDYGVGETIPITLRIEALNLPTFYPFRLQTVYFDPEGRRFQTPDIDLVYEQDFEVSVPFKITERHIPGEYEIEFSIAVEGTVAVSSTTVNILGKEPGELETKKTEILASLPSQPESEAVQQTPSEKGARFVPTPTTSSRTPWLIFFSLLVGIVLVRLIRTR